ncbi:MAG: efflux RND transporter permease subunit [Sphingomonadales bacterium]|nr:efflux RND transporter permease subunit [Sphingomonadales bacterium]MDE2172095.1 efflux RND transporter permease subunit [Sphingomonadales bacterium]
MSTFLVRYAKAIWFALALLTLGGLVAALRLPVGLFPHIDYPRILVSIDAGDRDPQAMQAQITRPLEIALRGVPGVTKIRSTTSRGAADIALSFNWGDDMVAATLATQGALAEAQPGLPAGTQFAVRRSDPTIFPVVGLALTSTNSDPEALRQFAELKLRPLLLTVHGVAGIDVLGGAPREVQVEVDVGRLQALGLAMSDVTQALSVANSVQGVGRIEDRHRLYLVMVDNRLTSIADIAAIPIRAGTPAPAVAGTSPVNAGIVTLGQVARITPSAQPQWIRVTSNGTNAVLVNVRQNLNGDTVAIVKAIDQRLAAAHLPSGVKVETFYDQSELVTGAASAVRDAILLGALLAGGVLFFFLRSGRLMLITGLMLPAVLAATCLILSALGESFNMMTLGGLAAAVGLVVDDAVVMLEHVMRRAVEEGRVEATSLLKAAAEMGRPLVGSTLATIVVFLPLAFISGVSGGFFKALAVTMVASLGVSMVYSRFVIPLVSAHWLRSSDAQAAEKANGLMDWLGSRYRRLSLRVLARPGLWVACTAMVLGLAGVLAYAHVGSGFMPAMDEGGFILDYKARPGAALSDTDRVVQQVESIIRTTPEVASYSRRTGAQLGGGLTEVDEGDFFVRLKDGSRRPIDEVMAEVRQKVQEQVPGIEIETAQLMEDLIGDLTAVPQPIEIKLFGDNAAELAAAAQRVAAGIKPIDGVVEVVDGLRVAGDAITVRVDRAAAISQGLDPDSVARQLETMIGGTVATQYQLGEQIIGVRVRAPAEQRLLASQIAAMQMRATDGHLVSVRQVAMVSTNPGQRQLTREDLAPFVAVTARLEGRDLGSAMVDVKQTVANLRLPASVRVDYGGLYAVQQASFLDLAAVLAAALLLSALLLTVLFNSMRYTLGVMATVLLSACAVLVGLWVTGIELDISALMGLTMVVGMVTELAIFYLFELADLERHGSGDPLVEAGHGRLRPILMSAMIAILTLAPLALGLSRGAGLQQPLATAIIFGLTMGAPLVLFFLPATLRIGYDQRKVVDGTADELFART